jgi:muramoyltetrapeptide carboxypeptidase
MSPSFQRFALKPGMRIEVIAPASPFPSEDFARGVARLRERYEVHYDPAIEERTGYFAGSDDRRTAELLTALHDDSVHAIVAARGGYGATRLLDRLSVAEVAAHPKLLVGFSDVSALHALWARARLGSLHAMMVAALGRCSDVLAQRFVRALEGGLPEPVTGLQALALGQARGPLLGGNLAVLTALLGTPHALPLAGAVLFLEDVGERPYRIDRMLTTWRQSGALSQLSAIALGAFTEAEPGPDGVRVEQVLQERLGGLGIPVLAGVPAGHVNDNLELPLGANVSVDASRGTLAFEPEPS